MGWGDEIMGAGMARGAAARGVRIAFGDGKRIMWTVQAHEIYEGNPNVAAPGQEDAPDLEWIAHYPGRRAYHLQPNRENGRWRYDPAFRPRAGELFFTPAETRFAASLEPGFVLLEPEVKPTGPYKQWGRARWTMLAHRLRDAGFRIAQFAYGGPDAMAALPGAEIVRTRTFREAAAALTRARAAVLPEGGLHHAAAAVGIPAVVIYGGHIHPDTTGYAGHANLFTGGAACGAWREPCAHCRKAMERITVPMVTEALDGLLQRRAA